MSTLKLPLLPLNHGRSRSDSTSSRVSYQYQPLSEMPRTFISGIDTIHESVNKKRKHEGYDSSVYITPTKQAGDQNFQITTPRSKKAKTAPSSPTYSNVYATPKTPKFKSDIPLHNNYSVTSPEFYTTSTVNFSNTVVTPPNSLSGSPKQNISILKVSNIPSTIIPESSFSYPDTCYSFNLTGSTVTKNESNVRSSITEKQNNEWRSYVVDKVKHENNQSYKKYQTFSSKLKDQEIKKSSSKLPKLNDETVFPYASKLTDFVQNQYKNYGGLVNYPYSSNYSYQTTNYLKDVQKLTSDSELYKRQPKRENPLQKVNTNFFLPPISEILKISPIDKTMVHPCALSNSEIKQYNNSLKHGIVLERNFKQFNKPLLSHQCHLHQHHLEDNCKVSLPSLNYDLFPDESYIHVEQPEKSTVRSDNIEPSVEKLHEELKLKVYNSRKQLPQNSNISTGKRKTSSRSRSRSRSRSSTPTGISKPRTRSSSRSKTYNSTPILKTAENTPPASNENTPQMSPLNSFINIPSKPPSLPLASLSNTIAAPIAVPLLSTSDLHSNVSVIAPIVSSLGSPINILSHDHIHNNGYSKITTSHQKRCISCFSTSSPCWRPSWSAEEGQLCNSCGLRYKKTKARCLNPRCLRIPAKGEWNLMLNRGKVLLNVVDEEGHVIGQTNSYKCLQCDGAMEVS